MARFEENRTYRCMNATVTVMDRSEGMVCLHGDRTGRAAIQTSDRGEWLFLADGTVIVSWDVEE